MKPIDKSSDLRTRQRALRTMAVVVIGVAVMVVWAPMGAPGLAAQGTTSIRGYTLPRGEDGTIRIPELSLEEKIVDGYFEFSNIELPRSPMLVSLEVEVDGFRPETRANGIVLVEGLVVNYTFVLAPGDEPLFHDTCAGFASTPDAELSAAAQQHKQLCVELEAANGRAADVLPGTGTDPPGGRGALTLVLAVLITAAGGLVGAALLLRRRVQAIRS